MKAGLCQEGNNNIQFVDDRDRGISVANGVTRALIGGGGGGGGCIYIYSCSARLISFEMNVQKN